jgi:hypothetical protein
MRVKEESTVGSKLSGLHGIRISVVRITGVRITEGLLYFEIYTVFCNGISSSVTRQAMYVHVTWRRVRLTIVVVQKQKFYIFWVCVCSLSYPERNAHASYCHLWPAPLYNIFPHYLINGTIFVKNLLNIKWVFWFSLQILFELFLMLRRTERNMAIRVYTYSCKVTYLRKIVMKLEFCRKILEKYSNIKFHSKPSGGIRVVPCGRTDRQKWRS